MNVNKHHTCKFCKKVYKTEKWLNKHIEKDHLTVDEPKREIIDNSKKEVNIVKKLKKRKTPLRIKKRISPIIRYEVWEKYIGNKIIAKCFCCRKNNITPFTNNNTFHAGHILSESRGGKIELDNLLPICQDCNKSMYTTHWDDWVKFNNFPLRIWGNNIPNETHNKATNLQKTWLKLKAIKSNINIIKKKQKKKKKKKKKKPNYMHETISSKKKYRTYI